MKNKKRKIIIISTLALIMVAVFTISAILFGVSWSNLSKINSDEAYKSSLRDDAYYATLLDTDNKLDEVYFKSTVKTDPDDGHDYVAITGFKVTEAQSYANTNAPSILPSGYTFADASYSPVGFMFSRFVDIPETLGGKPVEEIDFSGWNVDTDSAFAASFVRALRIPKSVKKMNAQALKDFGALQYLETPFIGIERGSSANYLMWTISGETSGETPESFPFVKMFSSYPSTSTVLGAKVLIDEGWNIFFKVSTRALLYIVTNCKFLLS